MEGAPHSCTGLGGTCTSGACRPVTSAAKPMRTSGARRMPCAMRNGVESKAVGVVHMNFGAFCLDVRTLAFCQLMGFPLDH